MPPDGRPHWRLIPRFLLRRAGFGFDLLEPTADQAVLDQAAVYRAALRCLEGHREVLLRQVLPPAVIQARAAGDRAQLRSLSALRSAVGRRRPVPRPSAGTSTGTDVAVNAYLVAQAGLTSAAVSLAEALEAEATERPARLRKNLSSAVLDAILQLAPSFYDSLARWNEAPGTDESARDRALMRRLYLYLQRLAAKNETTSFFGPLVHGTVDAGVADVQFGPDTAAGVTQTRAFLSFWAVCALARRIAEDPRVRPAIPITWVAAARLDGQILTLANGARTKVGVALARVAAAVDGKSSQADLASALEVPASVVSDALDKLERLGAVRCWPEPASTVAQPLTQLLAAADLHAAGTEWPGRLRGLLFLLERYAGATSPPQRRADLAALELEFTELAAVNARRSGGRMYADRMVAYLECSGDLGPVRLGADEAERVAAELAPALDFGARYGEEVHRAYNDLALAVLGETGVSRMPYDEFARRVGAAVAGGGLAPLMAGAAALQDRLTDLVAQRLHDGVAVLSATDLRSLGSPDTRPRFASPDLLLRLAGTGPRLVLGEVHPYAFAWGSQHLFCEDPDGLRADFASDLSVWGGKGAIATVVRRRVHKGLVAESFPGRFIEVTAIASADRARVVPITQLVVEAAEGGGVRLCDSGGELVLYAGEDDHPHLAAFAPAPTSRLPVVRFGEHAPRIIVGDVVVQRACWWLQPGQVAGPAAAGHSAAEVFMRVQGLRVSLNLPRWVYAHVSHEPKPVCIDLDAPVAVEVLASLATAAGAEAVALTEMIPEPEALWLRKQGMAMTSELRLAMIRADR